MPCVKLSQGIYCEPSFQKVVCPKSNLPACYAMHVSKTMVHDHLNTCAVFREGVGRHNHRQLNSHSLLITKCCLVEPFEVHSVELEGAVRSEQGAPELPCQANLLMFAVLLLWWMPVCAEQNHHPRQFAGDSAMHVRCLAQPLLSKNRTFNEVQSDVR